ncbi:tryptophan-rich sensory protein [Paenibacillus sp. SGZ-1009]|uniref:tryptophan-rich sensory protein n=1 Tax=Paenibacillus campi TaxID=3106031 RepID=UPI002AFEE085|nr:tryptophan-rich sensory protein [Paenibacillus sp. SGZ-1009]
MGKLNMYRWLNVLGIAAVLVVNYMASALTLFGRDTGQISDQYELYITPAGYAFSIWSIIYVLLIGFIIYQFRDRDDSQEAVLTIGPWLFLNSLCNMGWLLLWHSLQLEIAVLVIVLLLVTLIIPYVKIRRIVHPTIAQIWFVKLPYSIYMGWVSVATILNIGIALNKNEWSGFGLSPTVWSVIGLIVGALIALVISYRFRDSIYPLVFVWAYVAIAVKHPDLQIVWWSAIVIAVVLLVSAIWMFFVRNNARD